MTLVNTRNGRPDVGASRHSPFGRVRPLPQRSPGRVFLLCCVLCQPTFSFRQLAASGEPRNEFQPRPSCRRRLCGGTALGATPGNGSASAAASLLGLARGRRHRPGLSGWPVGDISNPNSRPPARRLPTQAAERALHAAAKKGDLAALESILAESPELANCANEVCAVIQWHVCPHIAKAPFCVPQASVVLGGI